jgi:hypothetical protein
MEVQFHLAVAALAEADQIAQIAPAMIVRREKPSPFEYVPSRITMSVGQHRILAEE